MSDPETYVKTADIRAAVQGHEEGILDKLGVDWRAGRPHIKCVYPSHAGADDWRWDAKKKRAFCTCIEGSDSILDVVAKVEGMSFDDAKVRACEMIARPDLVREKGGKGQKTDPASLLSPPAGLQAPDLPRAYLAFRLGVEPVDVPMPDTRAVGWSALPYVEATMKGAKTTFNEVAKPPCTVWETVAADGRRHAHRIYTGEGGQGKASLGTTPDGRARDPKKSASALKDGPSTAGCSVLWGNPTKTERAIVGEGVETMAAVALAYRAEIEAGTVVVAAAIAANGVAAWTPYPTTKRITVAADRDEAVKPSRPTATKAGEAAARRLGMAEHERGGLPVSISLPGERGTSVDWLDILRSDGVEAVRAGIEAAVAFRPTEAELRDRAERAGREAELERITALYPIPVLNGRTLFYDFAADGRVWLYKEFTKGSGENAVVLRAPIASPFGITARLRVVDDGDAYGLRLAVQDMDGIPRAIDLERKALATMGGAEARGLFLEAGVRFEDDGELVAVAALKAAHPTREIRIVRHPGWHDFDGARVYVAPGGEVIGLPPGQSVELAAGMVLPSSVARAGSLDEWKAAAAAAMTAPRCPHFILGLAAGFAGVLVDLCGMDSCGINLSGQTSAGKTTAQRLAASVWSVPDSTRPGLFQVAKTTVNGLEYLARKANGTVFALDELAHLNGKETGAVVYTLASGIGKTRMTAAATAREPSRWKTFAILSSETSLEAKIRADGGAWTGGQAVRIADVDVSNINRLVDSATFDRINGMLKNHGHAGPAFARALVDAGTHERAGEVRDGINIMARRLAGTGADPARIRAALPLAILAMAGGMAQTYGLLPQGEMLRDAIRWAWTGFQESSDAVALDPAEQAITNIRQWISEKWNTSVQWLDATERPTRDAEAWWDDEAVFIVPRRLEIAAGGTLKEAMIAKALNAAGMLAKTKDAEHLAVGYVRKLGPIKAYALSRAHFGREVPDDGTFKVRAGGRA